MKVRTKQKHLIAKRLTNLYRKFDNTPGKLAIIFSETMTWPFWILVASLCIISKTAI